MISKTQSKAAEFVTNGHTSSRLEILSNGALQHQKNETEGILSQFQNAVDNDSFYKAAELIFAKISEPKELAKFAELACKREPGGAFYRAKLWAKASQVIDAQEKKAQTV